MNDAERSIHRRLHEGYRDDKPARLAFVRRAYAMLPEIEAPRILDVGCGCGGPTLELARLSGGEVTGLDVDRSAVHELETRAQAAGLGQRIHARCGSMHELGFTGDPFDVVWAEASLHAMGFGAGLDACAGSLKPAGCLVIHEMVWVQPKPPEELASYWQGRFPEIRTVPELEAFIRRHGFSIIASFALPEEYWWGDYFRFIEDRIAALRSELRGNVKATQALDREQRVVDLHKRNRGWYGSAYFVTRKSTEETAAE